MASHHCIGTPCYICHPELNPDRQKDLERWPDVPQQALDEIAAMLGVEEWDSPVQVAHRVKMLWFHYSALAGAVHALSEESLLALNQEPLIHAKTTLAKQDEYWDNKSTIGVVINVCNEELDQEDTIPG